MATTITASTGATTGADTRSRGRTKGVPHAARLTAAQRHELESELRSELAALERRLINERADESAADAPPFALRDAAAASHPGSDTVARRDAVADALGRLASGTYGACARCAAPIPFGRLMAMPEVTHCLSCPG